MPRRVIGDNEPPNPEPNHQAELIRIARGAILVALARLYPQPAFRKTLVWLIDELGLTPEQFDAQIAYMSQRKWIQTRAVQVIGRTDLRITLTPDGYDVAHSIDPEDPVCD